VQFLEHVDQLEADLMSSLKTQLPSLLKLLSERLAKSLDEKASRSIVHHPLRNQEANIGNTFLPEDLQNASFINEYKFVLGNLCY